MATTTAGEDVLATLTARQREVYALTEQGLSAAQMAERLGISVNGVHGHLKTLRQRKALDRHNRPRVKADADAPAAEAPAAASNGTDIGRSVIEGDIERYVPSIGKVAAEVDERLKIIERERDRLVAIKQSIVGEPEPVA